MRPRLLLLACFVQTASAAAEKPHLVFLLGDDVGFGDVGYADPEVLSPNIDALAMDGIRLGRQYSYMWCSPSRAALLTGVLPAHTGVYMTSGATFALSKRFPLLPEMLSEAGYVSHAVGKWHLGMYDQQYLPESRGFSTYLGYLNGGEDYYYHDNRGNQPRNGSGVPTARPVPSCGMHSLEGYACTANHSAILGYAKNAKTAASCCAACTAYSGCGAWTFRSGPPTSCLMASQATPPAPRVGISCGSIVPFPNASATGGCLYRDFWDSTVGGPARDSHYYPHYSTYIFAQRAVDIITNHVESPQIAPLFLYLPFQAAHSPREAPDLLQRRYASFDGCQAYRNGPLHPGGGHDYVAGGGKGCAYCACERLVVSATVSGLDDAVGNITNTLKSTGLWAATVLVFSGDNGGPQMLSHWNAGLRGGKWTWFEGGIRPCAFITSPLLPAAARGRWYNGTIHLVDWLPTFLELAGVRPRGGLDGVSQWAALTGAAPVSPRNRTLIAKGILIAGRWKLSTIPLAGYGEPGVLGRQGWDCLLGTGGGWLPELRAGDVGDNDNLCPTISCGANITDPIDRWLCDGQCSAHKPCLWDVEADPGERHNLAQEMASVVTELNVTLAELDARVVPPYAPVEDVGHEMCKVFASRWGGYFGPWLQPG